VRSGWFALPDAHREVVRAVRVGGTATAATVAKMRGLWVADDSQLHVRVRYSTGRLSAPHDRRQPLDRVRHRVCVHYGRPGPFDRAADPLTRSLAEMFACGDVGGAIATVDSALETGTLHLAHLDLIRSWMPPSKRALLDLTEPDAQSGIETKVRLFLRSRRIPFRVQVAISGVGRVDLLVGERLVIELDGRAFHRIRVRRGSRARLRARHPRIRGASAQLPAGRARLGSDAVRDPGARRARRAPLAWRRTVRADSGVLTPAAHAKCMRIRRMRCPRDLSNGFSCISGAAQQRER